MAVIEGRYEVFLGRTRGVPRLEGRTVLGVELGEAGEVTRHAVALQSYDGDDESGLRASSLRAMWSSPGTRSPQIARSSRTSAARSKDAPP